MSRAGTGLRPSCRAQGMGREAASPSTLCQKRVRKGEHPHPLQAEPHSRGSPSGSAVRGTKRRRRGAGVWPQCGRRFQRSHLQVPPLPGLSPLAGVGVSVWQAAGRLRAGLHCLHPLLQAAPREHHVAGADSLRPRLPHVLLAVPDAVAKVDEQACRGDRDSTAWLLAPSRLAAQHNVASNPLEQAGKAPRGLN